MIRIHMVLLTLLLAGAETAETQNRRIQQDRDRDDSPVVLLLELRDDLDLTSRQIARLQRIGEEMERTNRPLLVQMNEIRRRIRALGRPEDLTAEKRVLFESYLAEGRPLMQKIQENNWTAMRQVGEVLTAEQKERVARLLREWGDNDRERSGDFPRPQSRGN